MALTKRGVARLTYDPDGPDQQILWDRDLAGFGVRVYRPGKKTGLSRKSFVLAYRSPGGRPRIMVVGKFGAMTLHQARETAKLKLLELAGGTDPLAERQDARQGLTLSEFADVYLDRHAKTRKKSWKEDERRIGSHVLPRLGSRKLEELTRADVAGLHARLASTPYEANRVLALVSVMLSCAAEWGHYPDDRPNPCRYVKPYRERSRDRWVRKSEMPALLEAIEAEESPFVRALFMLYLLTGCRKSELLRARWTDVDLERGELRLPETKAGEAQTVPLSPAALEILGDLPRALGNSFIFPSPTAPGEPLRHVKRAWRRIRDRVSVARWSAENPEIASELRGQAKQAGDEKRSEYRAHRLILAEIRRRGEKPFDVRLHDLRRTVGSWLATSGPACTWSAKSFGTRTPTRRGFTLDWPTRRSGTHSRSTLIAFSPRDRGHELIAWAAFLSAANVCIRRAVHRESAGAGGIARVGGRARPVRGSSACLVARV